MRTILSLCLLLCAGNLFGQAILVKDINPGPSTSFNNSDIRAAGNVIVFNAVSGGFGIQPWRSDGTAAGTYLLKDIFPSPSSQSLADIGVLNGNFFFFTNTALWKSDGTTAGTAMLKSFPNAFFFDPARFFQYNGYLYFNYGINGAGEELWRTDGTANGTVQVAEINPGNGHSIPRDFTIHNGLLYFTAFNSSTGRELYKSDGTANGTVLVKDIRPGSFNSEIGTLVSTPLGLAFSANDGTHGFELWISDGTEAGTRMVTDLNPSGDGYKQNASFPAGHAYANGKILFRGETPDTGQELFATDGTAAGTAIVKELGNSWQHGIFNSPVVRIPFKEQVLVVGPNSEPWVSDGTDAGTQLLKDINPGGSGSFPYDFTPHQGRLYFVASSADTGSELWVTDGTTAGTQLVVDVRPGPPNSDMDRLVSAENFLYFYADDGVNGNELWALGPTVSAPVPVQRELPLEVFPNPATDRITLLAPESPEGRLDIFDARGAQVRQIQLEKHWSGTSIGIGDLPEGVYTLRVQTASGSAARNIVVKKR